MAEEQALPEGFVPYTPQSQDKSLPAGFEMVNTATEEPFEEVNVQEAEMQPDEIREPSGILISPTKFTEGMAEGYKKGLIGAADLAVTGIVAGATEIASGWAGIIAYGLSGGDIDEAADVVRNFQDKGFSALLKSEEGQTIVENIAPSLSKADYAITNFAEDAADGDPVKATVIKTLIYGGSDALAAIFPLAKPVKDLSKIKSIQRTIRKDAERLGIELKAEHFVDDVKRAAKELGSTERGQAADDYVRALRSAEYTAKLKKNSKYLEAMDTDLDITTAFMRDLQKELLDINNPNSLIFSYDLQDMPKVTSALNRMNSGYFSAKNSATEFKRVESFRKQLNAKINNAEGSEKTALIKMKRALDDKLTSEFNNAMLNNGQSALSGDPTALNTWIEARKLAQEHAWFNDTKVIADLINKDVNAEQLSTWLVGASSSGAKKQAATVIRKVKKLLGDDHPAIDAIRADFSYELMSPLLQAEPNLQRFLNNFDLMIRNNHSVVKELGILDTDIDTLRKFAETARYLPEGGHFYSLEDITKAFAQISVGHGVAKGAARVKFMTKTLKLITGQDLITEKEILRSLTNNYIDEPIIPSDSLTAIGVTAAAAVSGTMDEN